MPVSPGMTLVDVGCGPTLSNVFAASKKFDYIVLSDLTEKNRSEVRKSLQGTPNAIDWSLVAQSQARREGHA